MGQTAIMCSYSNWRYHFQVTCNNRCTDYLLKIKIMYFLYFLFKDMHTCIYNYCVCFNPYLSQTEKFAIMAVFTPQRTPALDSCSKPSSTTWPRSCVWRRAPIRLDPTSLNSLQLFSSPPLYLLQKRPSSINSPLWFKSLFLSLTEKWSSVLSSPSHNSSFFGGVLPQKA